LEHRVAQQEPHIQLDSEALDARENVDLGQAILEQTLQLWVQPELARRQSAGTLAHDFQLRQVQVLLEVDQPPTVRLNEEVRAVVRAVAQRAIQPGEEVGEEDLGDIATILLTDADPNAGHVTMVLHRGAWWIAFDFRYNAGRVNEHIQAAREFLDSATADLEGRRLRSFCEALLAAAELLAKARLLQLPEPKVLRSKTHGTISSEFNRWARSWPDLHSGFAGVFNRLQELRGRARYLGGDLSLELSKAADMLAVIEATYTQIRATAPRRASTGALTDQE
jgi:hypothetical protein